VDVTRIVVDTEAVEKIPEQLAEKYNMLGIKLDGNTLTMAVDDPLSYYGIEDIRAYTQMNLELVLDTAEHIESVRHEKYSEVGARQALARAGNIADAEAVEDEGVEEVGEDAPVVTALNRLLLLGENKGASDIHIEPFEDRVLVRSRIDGVITETTSLPKSIHLPLIARIKILADMDIAERRVPQDGHFNTKVNNQEINARVSVIPTVHGEKAVIRFIYSDIVVDGAGYFGMNEEDYRKLSEMVEAPHGMIYITGPTGSGKTTTLYMILDALSKKPINISTIEDPVERNLDKINQMQVNNQAGLTFEAGLRALLRQDPDVIMVGETRDAETASISVRAAITGHQVYSTLHTNDALSAVVRLMDMGMPSYMVANSLSGLVAQRLVRKICPECGMEYEASEDECRLLGVEKATLKKGRGCPICNGTGYRGRKAVHEVVVMDKEIRRMIVGGASEEEMEAALRKKNRFVSLRERATQCVLAGETTIEEFNKVVDYTDVE